MIPVFEKNNREKCCGCEVCASVCPVSIIKMNKDAEGFSYPQIDAVDKCIDCHLCEKYCPEISRTVKNRPSLRFCSGFALQEDEIKTSSSGGFATLLSSAFIDNGGIVYGVRYSDDFLSIEYARATTLAELNPFKSSKYCQSAKKNLWADIRKDMKDGKRVLFIGLPCEVAAVNNLFAKSNANLYTIELVCHGVSSPLVHEEFMRNVMDRSHRSPVSFFSVRHKKGSWKPYYILIGYQDGAERTMPFHSSTYDIAFRYMKRPSCNVCRFKYNEKEFGLQADMTIGDNHGVSPNSSSFNRWGSSMAIIHSEKGCELFKSINEKVRIQEENESIVYQNLALYKPFPVKRNREAFSRKFVKDGLESACRLSSVRLSEFRIEMKRYLRRIKSRTSNLIH